MDLFSLEGKNAWITGACYGIGFSIAKAFVKAGCSNVIFNARSGEAIEKALRDYHDAVNGHILYVDGGILAYIGKQPK